MFILFYLPWTVIGSFAFGGTNRNSGADRSIVNHWRFMDVKELAPVSISTAAVVLKIGTNFGLIILIQEFPGPQFLFCVSEGTLTIGNDLPIG